MPDRLASRIVYTVLCILDKDNRLRVEGSMGDCVTFVMTESDAIEAVEQLLQQEERQQP
jgi:hypothetical protein